MRLWSIHPKYLDPSGFGGLWNESNIASKCLYGQTDTWKRKNAWINHSQLDRFKFHFNPKSAISFYRLIVFADSLRRSYNYNIRLIQPLENIPDRIPVTEGQVLYEFTELYRRIEKRCPAYIPVIQEYIEKSGGEIDVHPLFYVVNGVIEPWEKGDGLNDVVDDFVIHLKDHGLKEIYPGYPLNTARSLINGEGLLSLSHAPEVFDELAQTVS